MEVILNDGIWELLETIMSELFAHTARIDSHQHARSPGYTATESGA